MSYSSLSVFDANYLYGRVKDVRECLEDKAMRLAEEGVYEESGRGVAMGTAYVSARSF
jgi:hypothetical protein